MEDPYSALKIVLIGSNKVGKATLSRRFQTNQFQIAQFEEEQYMGLDIDFVPFI